jgi:hypothetical protein
MGAGSTGNAMMDAGVQFAGGAQAGARGIGDTGLTKGAYSVTEQRDRTQAQQMADRDARAMSARAAERGEDREFTIQRDEAAREQAENMARLQARLQAGNRPPTAPQLTQGNDGFMYRYDNGRMVRVPIEGMPSGGGDAGRSVEIPATGPRRDAVRPQAPGDTMFRGMGLTPAPQRQAPAPSFDGGGEARGPFGKAPSTGPKTEGQLNADAFATRMESTAKVLDAFELAGGDPVPPFMTRVQGAIPFGGNELRNRNTSKEQQLYRAAQDDWVRAKLRKESGAVIGEDEMADERTTYFKQPGDDPETVAYKRTLRATATQMMRKMSGSTAEGDLAAKIAEARANGYSDADIQAYLTGVRP